MNENFFSVNGHKIPFFEGKMYRGAPKRASNVYHGMKSRCNNPSAKSYKYYGGKGVSVKVTAVQFVSWYLYWDNLLSLDKPSVNRIDHSGDYSFDNMELIELADNSREAGYRPSTRRPDGYPNRSVIVYDWYTKEDLMKFYTIKEASLTMGLGSPILSKHIGVDARNARYFGIRYEDDT